MGFYVVQQGLIFWVFNPCQYSDDGSDCFYNHLSLRRTL